MGELGILFALNVFINSVKMETYFQEWGRHSKPFFLIWLNKLPLKIVVAVTLSFDSYKFLLPCLGYYTRGPVMTS